MTVVRGSIALLGVLGLVLSANGGEPAEPDLGLKVPDGFRVRVFADESLANDTYAMTLDATGLAVVTTRGSITTLHDDNGDGRADRATVFATTETGGMGLSFDGNDLWFCGDGWLSRYRDADGDGRADGPPERLLPLAFTEHGGHAVRKGPDGWWYVIGGNDSGIGPGHATLPGSPVVAPEAGALLRLTPDGSRSEILADGFRNPYDFDFQADGAIITYDSDVERDIFLPWYAPTRLFHVAPGGHHGWRLKGFLRSWPRPGYDPGTVDVLAAIGRGSPTGVVSYRHRQFPARFRGGLFVLDWTFGKVYFVTLTPFGSTYRAKVEVFLEPKGTSGFAPTDAVVAPDGALMICIGGRRTRGSVYRVEYVGPREESGEKNDRSELDMVLRAPQPLDAWSRARWMPLARKLGREPILQAISDRDRTEAEQVRAVEVLTELFGGLDGATAKDLMKNGSAAVRRRVAWSLGRTGGEERVIPLVARSADLDPGVCVAALDAWSVEGWKRVEPVEQRRILREAFGHSDKRVRQSSARVAARSPEMSREWLRDAPPQAELNACLTELFRHPEQGVHELVARRLCNVIDRTNDPGLRLQAVRLIQRALGDAHLDHPAVEVETGYSLQTPMIGIEAIAARVRTSVRAVFPSGNDLLDDESARLLAMLEDDDAGLPRKVAAFWTDQSSATRDLHFLIVLARLRGPLDSEVIARTAHAVVALDGKLEGQEQRIKQSWNARVAELVGLFLARDGAFGPALLREPKFLAPNHVALALALAPADRERAARGYLGGVKSRSDFPWSGALIDLLSVLPEREVRPLFRGQWENFALRDSLLPRLASPPEVEDRAVYLDALDSSQPEVVKLALLALETLPRDGSPNHLVALLRLLRRLTLEPREAVLRGRVLALIARQSGVTWDRKEAATDPAALRQVYQPVFDRFLAENPGLSARLNEGAGDLAGWSRRLARVDWASGDAGRGAKVFQDRGCQTCHSGPRSLGPDLSGVTGRLSREDLFTAIVAPSLDVSPLYRVTQVEGRSGQVDSGMVAFESADGLILQTGAATTLRIATPDIVSRRVGTRSLMPDGLLQGLNDRDLSDLDRYLRSLSAPAR